MGTLQRDGNHKMRIESLTNDDEASDECMKIMIG